MVVVVPTARAVAIVFVTTTSILLVTIASAFIPHKNLCVIDPSARTTTNRNDHSQSWNRIFSSRNASVNDDTSAIISSTAATIADQWRRNDLFGTSIIEETILSIGTTESKEQQQQQVMTTKEERKKQRRSLQQANVPNFEQYIQAYDSTSTNTNTITTDTATNEVEPKKELSSNLQQPPPLTSFYRYPTTDGQSTINTLQINIGLYCNQACQHCHVESSPLRTKEMMSMEVLQQCLVILQNTPSITTLDITGGAPELHEHYRTFVAMVRSIRPTSEELDIIDRCNLTVLQEPGQGQELINFFKEHSIHVIASLPCYSEQNVKEQRGNHVFERSIAALIALNDAGYGITAIDSSESTSSSNNGALEYKLDLVYNPNGAFLPPSQVKLQEQYKKELYNSFGIRFNDLYTITNMPIQRFADYLHRKDQLISYMNLLVSNYNPSTIENVMCRNTVSVRYDGTLYDCDFNQQLDIPILSIAGSSTVSSSDGDDVHNTNGSVFQETKPRRSPMTIFDIQSLSELQYNKIRTDVHCFGCTAGMGSSCQGTTAA